MPVAGCMTNTTYTMESRRLAVVWSSLLSALLINACSGVVMNVNDCRVLAAPPNWVNIRSCNPPPVCVVDEFEWSWSETPRTACDATGRLLGLNLARNKLTGTLPAAWSALSKLQRLHLSVNKLAGTLPKSWSTLRQLKQLYLGGNKLAGTLPASWSAMSNLETLDLQNNTLAGTLPASWSAMSSLTALDMTQNILAGTLPASWGAMRQLSTLKLGQNRLAGTLPDSWNTMRSLGIMHLYGNKLGGALPASWSAMSNLWYLYMQDNKLTGTLPASWSALSRVSTISLGNNTLNGTLPASWSVMSDLGVLNLESNKLTGGLPASWTSIGLYRLYLFGNKLNGTLPASWSKMSTLDELYVGNNKLTGTLPASWSALVSVSRISLGNNTLNGTLPASWSVMRQLRVLDLGKNKLGGTLPASWSALSRVFTINLGANKLNGKLPASWSAMSNMVSLFLFNNSLEGTLPTPWSAMSNLKELHVANTRLCGTLPKALQPRLFDLTRLPACPGPKPPPSPPKPSSQSPPPSSSVRCGRWFNNARCSGGSCCSRWGWCGTTRHHCRTNTGCQAQFGSCISSPRPVAARIGDGLACGFNTMSGEATRCNPGFCCNAGNRCSSVVQDCSPHQGCQEDYGMCFYDAEDVQSGIDQALDSVPAASQVASTKASNATFLSLFSFFSPNMCNNLAAPCIMHSVISASDTLESVAALYGTNAWQLQEDNSPQLVHFVAGVASLRPKDRLVVRPVQSGPERIKWLWKDDAALILGRTSYPRPCSSYQGFERKSCFCHYHSDGTFIWPFSANEAKCREVIECKGKQAIKLIDCPDKQVADDSDEYNGNTKCRAPPVGFDYSMSDGCRSILCFCREFLLADGLYLNPFDSTRRTALWCDHTKPGWFGGLYDCEAGNYFDPVKRLCTTTSQAHHPFRRGYTSCAGVPDSTAQPLPEASTGRRKLVGTTTLWLPRPSSLRLPKTRKKDCVRMYNIGVALKCMPCKGCVDGQRIYRYSPSSVFKRCTCQVIGFCPLWFNRNCRY